MDLTLLGRPHRKTKPRGVISLILFGARTPFPLRNLGGAGVIASALVGAAYFAGPPAAVLIGTVAIAITNMSTLAPQPQLWYRDGWASKPTYIEKYARLDRREVYNTNFRQWHWRICEEMLGYTFSPASMNKPLLLMVGEIDDYNYVHFLGYVKAFAAALKGPAQGGLTIQDTGHLDR